MNGKCRLAVWAMREEFQRGKDWNQMLETALHMLDELKNEHTDLICFPEIFLKTGDNGQKPDNYVEIQNEMLTRFAEKARELHSYILTSYYEQSEKYPGMQYNCAALIDRNGLIAGKYRKVHIVTTEYTGNNVLPGSEFPVFDTDFGTIGIQTCFDIGWREGWNELAKKGARLVIWDAAYDGGNLLDTYAVYNMYYVASTVRTNHARIIDPMGQTVSSSSRWNGLAIADIDLSGEVFHIDRQWQTIDTIIEKLGSRVHISTLSEENCFYITSDDPDWPVERIKKEFSLMSYRNYHIEADTLQKRLREQAHEFSDDV